MTDMNNDYVLTIPEQFDFETYKLFKQQLSRLSNQCRVVVDFQHIKRVDYYFLHTLLAMATCFVSSLNEIKFINFSDEVNELFDEVNIKQLLKIPKLIY